MERVRGQLLGKFRHSLQTALQDPDSRLQISRLQAPGCRRDEAAVALALYRDAFAAVLCSAER